LAAIQRAFELNNDLHLFSYSLMLGEFRRFKRKRYLLERAVSLDPENPHLRWALGMLQIREGDYANGWKNFRRDY
jgi:hypothetical protein